MKVVMTKSEILTHFLSLHDALGTQADAPDREEFDKQHRKIWTKCEEDLRKRLVKLQYQDTLSPSEIIELSELLAYLKI